MTESVPVEITAQVRRAQNLIELHLGATVQAIHLFGSAIDGGLKPYSDIDLLVTVNVPPNEAARQALMLDLLQVSAPPGSGGPWRPLEVTVIVLSEVVPWRYPARRELQFGEWLRHDLLAGIFEPAFQDNDLAILLTKARQHSVAIVGPPAATVFAPVPKDDFTQALANTIDLWNSPDDWQGDERNVVLTLARIWYSTVTGQIAPKDVAAAWVLERLPAEHQPVLSQAREVYLNGKEERLAVQDQQTTAFIHYAKAKIKQML